MILKNNISDIESLENTSKQIYFHAQMEVNLCFQNSQTFLRINVAFELLPVSWFITSDNGKLVKSGVSYKSLLFISVSDLPKGEHTLRMKGEKFTFEV